MRKEKFVYNTQTLRYEKVEVSLSSRLLRVFGFLCAAILTAVLFTLVLHRYFPSPEVRILRSQIDQMAAEYEHVMTDMDQLNKELEHLLDKDAYAYRMVFGMDPLDEDVLEGGIGGHNDNAELRNLEKGQLIIAAKRKVRKLKHQMVLQSKSLDTILTEAKRKEEMLAHIPSIKPVNQDRLARGVRHLSGYGYRIHPIYKTRKMHWGIDFTAPRGTAVQATGDGVVKRIEKRRTGYGYNVVIDHGYGYESLYAHFSKILVKKGDKVKRGQKIGEVGSTGTSTAPHCHYEIKYKGKKVNPIDYVLDGLTPAEYRELVDAASTVNQSLD
ncbi:MAG TPA: M23 family metallopeptidase [Saprospiraceae bacterium]|nr:M23 family metallopeptidase [Saprospiraceae bacterium]